MAQRHPSSPRAADQRGGDAALLRQRSERLISGGKSGAFVLGQGEIHTVRHAVPEEHRKGKRRDQHPLVLGQSNLAGTDRTEQFFQRF
jgi:hypothetical protein